MADAADAVAGIGLVATGASIVSSRWTKALPPKADRPDLPGVALVAAPASPPLQPAQAQELRLEPVAA